MKKILAVVVMLLAAHVVVSIIFIFFPSFPANAVITKGYKRYLLPGPFFTESRIKDSYTLLLSWKVDSKWSPPINPVLDNYARSFSRLSPSLLFRSSLERDMYEKAILKMDTSSIESSELWEVQYLRSYMTRKYIPTNVDSIKFLFVRSTTDNFEISVDTVQTITF
ncbi:MAG: hypothetical protein R2804_02300 [Cyclobacteriaceae bacterium]|jgi:hypothetical protein